PTSLLHTVEAFHEPEEELLRVLLVEIANLLGTHAHDLGQLLHVPGRALRALTDLQDDPLKGPSRKLGLDTEGSHGATETCDVDTTEVGLVSHCGDRLDDLKDLPLCRSRVGAQLGYRRTEVAGLAVIDVGHLLDAGEHHGGFLFRHVSCSRE